MRFVMTFLLLLGGCDGGADGPPDATVDTGPIGIDGGMDGSPDTSSDMDGATDGSMDTSSDAPLGCDAAFSYRPCGNYTSYWLRCGEECVCPPGPIYGGAFAVCETDDAGTCFAEPAFCEAIETRTFVSVEEHECGLGPAGPEMCRWRIEFRGGRFDWSYSDVVESGDYTCDGNDVTSEMYTGSWDEMSSVLTWDGVAYEVVPLSCAE